MTRCIHGAVGLLGEMARVSESVGQLGDIWAAVAGQRMFGRVSTRTLPTGLPPVMMLHGLSVSSWYLTPVARRLAPFCPVYLPDLPGFGRSENPPRILTIAGMSDALASWMRAVGLERAVILGHSVGCQVAARFATRYPEMTLGVILVSPTMDPDMSGLALFLRGLLNFTYEPGVMTVLAGIGATQGGPWRAWRTFLYALSDQCENVYPAIQAPALVVRGARDPIAPQDWAERVARMPPRGRPLHLLPGRTHAMNMNAPRALLGAILPFLREIADVTRPPRQPFQQAYEPLWRAETDGAPSNELELRGYRVPRSLLPDDGDRRVHSAGLVVDRLAGEVP
jgi:2-hydroxy-6-oxonona-2,4-dienedioate hydrolase